MYNLYKSLEDNSSFMAYLGEFSDQMTDQLIDLTEHYLASKSQMGKIKNKVSFLIAESFQNIVRHGIFEKKVTPVTPRFKDYFQVDILGDRIKISSAKSVRELGVS